MPVTASSSFLGRLLAELRSPGRTVAILVPVHLAAFTVLYLSVFHVVKGEFLRTYSHDAEILMRHAVADLHPAMVSLDRDEVQRRLQGFVEQYALPSLTLYHRDGSTLFDPSEHDAQVRALAAGGEDEKFWISTGAGGERVNGVVRLVAEPACTECHEAGSTVGYAAMTLDVTDVYAGARRRLLLNLALLLGAWGGVVAAIDLGLRSVTRRSVAHLRSSVEHDGARAELPVVAGPMLDSVSRELYTTLKEVVQQQREREDEVADRLLHTERLASLGKLAAGLAHEIKNPLAGVQGTIELLRDDCSDEQICDLYGQMLDELRRVNATIHSLLSFARPPKVSRVDADIAQLLEETTQLLRPGLRKKRISLGIEIAPTVGTFHLDRTQIRHVLLNLVHNAAEAIGENGTIRLRAGELPEGGGLLLAVEDDGPGIALDEQAKIFEPFYTTKFNGTGLGLAVVRSLVAQHGGRIEVRSAPGEGASFVILLPSPRPEAT